MVQEVPVVMDADGIAVVERSVTGTGSLFRGVSKAVLTPNAPEFWRLCDACGIEHGKVQPHDDSSLVQVCIVFRVMCPGDATYLLLLVLLLNPMHAYATCSHRDAIWILSERLLHSVGQACCTVFEIKVP